MKFLLLSLSLLCGGAFASADSPQQQVLDAGERFGFAAVESTVGKLAKEETICGITIPFYDAAPFYNAPQKKELGKGSFGRADLVTLDQSFVSQLEEREKRLLVPNAVLKSPAGKSVQWANFANDPARLAKKRFSTTKMLWLEAIIGRLLTDSALPETPVAAHVGAGKAPDDEHLWFSLLANAGQNTLENILFRSGTVDDSLVSKKADKVKAWEEFCSAFSFFPDPPSPPPAVALQHDASTAASLQEQKKARHNKAMAQQFDGALIALQQLMLGLLHFEQLGAAHNDIKPANVAFDAKKGLAVIDFGLSDLSFDYFRDPRIEMPPQQEEQQQQQQLQSKDKGKDKGKGKGQGRANGNVAVRSKSKPSFKTPWFHIDLPDSFKGYQAQGVCTPFAALGVDLASLLQTRMTGFGGTRGYQSPIKYIAAHPTSFDALALHMLGPLQYAALTADKRKYQSKNKKEVPEDISSPLIQGSSDAWAVGLIAMEMLTGGVDHTTTFLSDAPCNNPKSVEGMKLHDNYATMLACNAEPIKGKPRLPKEIEAEQNWATWRYPFHGLALSKWLFDDRLTLFKSKRIVNKDRIEAVAAEMQALMDGGGGGGGGGNDVAAAAGGMVKVREEGGEEEDAALAAVEIGVRILDEDRGRKRLFAYLHALSRYSTAAQHAVATGKRSEFSGQKLDVDPKLMAKGRPRLIPRGAFKPLEMSEGKLQGGLGGEASGLPRGALAKERLQDPGSVGNIGRLIDRYEGKQKERNLGPALAGGLNNPTGSAALSQGNSNNNNVMASSAQGSAQGSAKAGGGGGTGGGGSQYDAQSIIVSRFQETESEGRRDDSTTVAVAAAATTAPGVVVDASSSSSSSSSSSVGATISQLFPADAVGQIVSSPTVVDASKSDCPPGLWSQLAAKGNGATIPDPFLSDECKKEIRAVFDLDKLQVTNLPSSASSSSSSTSSSPAAPVVAGNSLASQGGPAPLSADRTAALNLGARPVWPPPPQQQQKSQSQSQPQPQPPRFLRAGGQERAEEGLSASLAVGEGDDDTIVVPNVQYSSGHISAFRDSPLGWIWGSPPRIDGKYDTVVANVFGMVEQQNDGKNAFTIYDLHQTLSRHPLSDSHPRFAFVDTRFAPNIKDKRAFELSEADLRRSAEEAPHVDGLEFGKRPATRGILDLIRGLLALHGPHRISFAKAVSLVDDIRLGIVDEIQHLLPADVLTSTKQSLRAHLDCVSVCTEAVHVFMAQNDPQQLTGDAACHTMSAAHDRSTLPFCPAVVGELLKYSLDGVLFTTLVKSDHGITAASFESLCRYKVCAKGSAGLVPQPQHPSIVQQALQPLLIDQQNQVQPSSPLKSRIKGWKRLRTQAVPLGEPGDKNSLLLVPYESLDGQMIVKVVEQEDVQNTNNYNNKQGNGIGLAGAYERISVSDQLAREIKHGFSAMLLSKRFGGAARNPAKAADFAVAEVVARKGPYGARWFTSFDSYSTVRLIELHIQSDPADAKKVRPAIRWLAPADKGLKKATKDDKNRDVVYTTQDFAGGVVEKKSRPIYISPNFRGAYTCNDLETLRRDNPRAGIPSVEDKCGSYKGGECLCVMLAKNSDHLRPNKVLRLFFNDGQQALAFVEAVQELIEAALGFSGVRKLDDKEKKNVNRRALLGGLE